MKHMLVFIALFLSTFSLHAQEDLSFDKLSETLSTEYKVDLTPTQINDRLTRIVESTVRVSVSGGVGTGTVYHEDAENYYILTNAHVVGNSRTVGLEFTKNHFASPRYVGDVEKRSLLTGQAFDVAVVKLKKSSLPAHIKLPVMEIAGPDDKPRQLLLITCGCQAGEMPSVQLTVTTKQDDKVIYYLPTSRPGRSGSSLVDIEGNKIYGLVAWMTGQGRDSQGLAMTSTRIRPWLFNESLSVSYIDNFPSEAREIPLASDSFIEQEYETVKQQGCDPDSCVNGVCPWDAPENQTQEQIEVDRWLRRFGPNRNQPQPTPPQQPRPGPTPEQPAPKQPSPLDSNPGSPLNSPQPEAPRQDTPKDDGQGDNNPWGGPGRILPIRPDQDKKDPPVQPKPDSLSDASKIDLIYDSLKNKVEPALLVIDSKVSSAEEANREGRRLLGGLRDRLNQIPDNLPQVPGQLNPLPDGNRLIDGVSDGLFQRFFNLPIIKDIRFIIRIALWIVGFFAIDWAMTKVLGPTWMVIVFGRIISFFSRVISYIWEIVSSLFSSLSTKFSQPKQETSTENVEELMKKLQELLKNQQPKE